VRYVFVSAGVCEMTYYHALSPVGVSDLINTLWHCWLILAQQSDQEDGDLTYSESVTETSESLRSSDFHYQYKNGCRYHSLHKGKFQKLVSLD
jgi:hypothetical protein